VTFKHLLNTSCSVVTGKFAMLTLSCMQETYTFCPSVNSLKSGAELIEQNSELVPFHAVHAHLTLDLRPYTGMLLAAWGLLEH